MSDKTEEDYGFCPKCGALMENGVCPECSGKNARGVYSAQNYPKLPAEQPGGQNSAGGCEKRPGTPEQAGQYQSWQGAPGAPGQYQSWQGQPGTPGQYQSWQGQPGAPGQQGQYQSWPGQPGAPGQYQSWQGQQGAPGQYQSWQGQPGAPGQQGQYQSWQGAPGQPGQYQSWQGQPGAPGQYQSWQEQPGAPGQYQSWQEQPGAPGQYQSWQGQPGAPGQYQSWQGQPGAPGQYPGWQGAPGQYPGWQGQNYGPYNPYMQPKKNNRIWIIMGILAVALLLLAIIGGICFYGYFISRLTGENILAENRSDEDTIFSYDGQNDADGGNGGDSGYAGGEDEEYVPSPDDEYYYGPCDSIDEDVDYSITAKSYTNEDPANNIDIIVNYVELAGDIPNIDQLNETLEKAALYYAVDFPKYSFYSEYGESYAVYTTSYVTYNDEDIISVVIDEYVVADNQYHVDLYPINIDLKNGVILDNSSLLSIDSDFAAEFRKRNNEQNGNIDYLDSLTDEQLAQALRDKQSVIAFYTPLGMEIGMNYSGGWVTVTYKDYEKYLTNF